VADGMRAPVTPIGRPDVLWGLPGQGGLLTEWAETVPDLTWPESVRTYGRMRRDARIKSVLSAYFLPILRSNWCVDPEGIDRAEAVDLVASNLGLPILGEKGRPKASPIKGFSWHDHCRLGLLNLIYGHMPFERWYEVKGGRTHLAGVQERQPHTIAIIDISDDGYVRQVFQNTQPEPIPSNRLLWYVNEREGANWAGVSLLRACYTPWVLKHETMRVHATAIRRFGMGVPSVTAPPGATPGQISQAQQLAAQMRVGDTAGAGLPNGFTFSLTGLTGSVPDAVGFLNYCDQQMSNSALAGIVELGHSTYGSRAMGESFLDLFLLSLQAGADAIGDVATIGDPTMPGLARSLVEYNWGEGEPVPRIMTPDVGDRHEITAFAINQLVTSGALVPDPNLEAFVREAWGLPERSAAFPVPPSIPKPPPPPKPPAPAEPGAAGGGGEPQPPPAQPGDTAQAGRWWQRPFRRRVARAQAGPDGLRRPLTAAEAASGMEPLVILAESKSALDSLLSRWEPAGRAMRQDLTEQVAAAVDAGNLPGLADLRPDTTAAADLLTTAMQDMAWTGAARMVKEAKTQGVDIDLAAITLDDARIAQVAQARAALIGARLAHEAARTALQVAAATPGEDAADSVSVALDGLSETPLADQLLAAMNAAQNMGRIEAANAGIDAGNTATFFATEILDHNTCQPCEDIDGYQFPSQDEAEAAYTNGGYVECEGRERCRGTIITEWGDTGTSDQAEPLTDIGAWDSGAVSALDMLSEGSFTAGGGDSALAQIISAQGFDAAPTTGSVDAEVQAGGTRIYRALHGGGAQGWADAYVSGTDLRQGLGTFGNGNYFGTDLAEAQHYGDVITEAALKASARVADHDTIAREWASARRGMNPGDPGWAALENLSRYAAMKGYDAISMTLYPGTGPDTFIILNRAALVVNP
jgi:hypothetical protein